MPKLSQLTDTYEELAVEELPVENPYRRIPVYKSEDIKAEDKKEGVQEDKPSKTSVMVNDILNKLFRDDDQRYQLWPEKVARSALTAVPDAYSGKIPMHDIDPETGEAKPSMAMIERAMDMSTFAGVGGLGGTTEATLGATPFLRPALKYKDRLYKGKEGQQHMDVIPEALYPEFQKMAMSGEDISHYNFGFHNDKGHFLDREKALQYAIDTGIVDQHAGKYGALTSTLLADSSKPGVAIESLAKAKIPSKGQDVLGRDIPDWRDQSVYHFTDPDAAKAIEKGGYKTGSGYYGDMVSFTPDPTYAKQFGSVATQAKISKDAKILNLNDPKDWEVFQSITKNVGSDKYAQAVKKAGYDGVYDAGAGDLFIANPKAVKHEKSINLKADSSKPAAAIEAMKANPFFSAVEHNLNAIPQTKMTGDQWLGTLSNKPGVKPEELDWTGLKSFLEENKGKAVSKEAIQEHLAANKVELKEVKKGAVDENAPEFNRKVEELLAKAKAENIPMMRSRAEDIVFSEMGEPTKYHSYQLPGGENYREMLLTLNKNKVPMEQHKVIRSDGHVDSTYTSAETAAARAAQIGGTVKQAETLSVNGPGSYKSSHWDEPNILAHVRMNDRTIDGKKSLHLEEIQADGHQAARAIREKEIDRLIKTGIAKADAQKQVPENFGYKLSQSEQKRWNEIKTKADKDLTPQDYKDIDNFGVRVVTNGLIPDLPFKKSWHELALKRMIREAAEKGYDRLSWTPGEAQAARYDLSKSISDLNYNPETKMLRANDKHNNTVINQMVEKDKLSDFIGKEAAKKLLDTPYNPKNPYSSHSLLNTDLKIGGEGMKGFYDKMIPQYLEKLGKEHGVKVKYHQPLATEGQGYKLKTEGGKEYLESGTGFKIHDPKAIAEFKQEYMKPVHYIDIPQSLRDTAMNKGFPLFSNKYMFTPVDHEPDFK